MDKAPLKVLVCGGGNGAHVFSTIASSRPGVIVNVLTIFENEAEIWNETLKSIDNMTAVSSLTDKDALQFKSRPSHVTKHPTEVVKDADIIFIVAPSYAHAPILKAIVPFCRPNTVIAGMPGHPGFEYDYGTIFGAKTRTCTMIAFETLPWACRILEYGSRAHIIGIKEFVGCAMWTGKDSNIPFSVLPTIQGLIGDKPKIKDVSNLTVLTLMGKTLIHPPIMFGKWSTWDKKPMKERPLFYQGVDDVQADVLSKVSNEVLLTAKVLQKVKPEVDMSSVTHVLDWYKEYYAGQIADDSSLKTTLQTNTAYDGLVHPMKILEDGCFVPDFTYRYTREDIPFGLVVLKGLAVIAGVSTPTINTIITWAQGLLNREFLVGDKLIGKDIDYCRAPQAFGIHTIDDLFGFTDKIENV